MRTYIDIVTGANQTLREQPQNPEWEPADEPMRRTRTKTRTRPDPTVTNFADPTSRGELTTGSASRAVGGRTDRMPAGSTASAASTRRSMRTGEMPAAAGSYMSDLMRADLGTDEISDVEAANIAGADIGQGAMLGHEPAEPTTENLPAVINQAVITTGDVGRDPVGFNPEWHQVKHLPGYLANNIRRIGRMVFAPFTDTPIEDIQVLSTLSNPSTDVKKMMAWIRQNGVRDQEAELKFDDIMPGMMGTGDMEDLGGYQAKVQIWSTMGYEFMLVRDFAGYYVYGWPGGRGVHLGGRPDAPRLTQR